MRARELYVRLADQVETTEARIRDDLKVEEGGAWLLSYDDLPGVWETAEALGIVNWGPSDAPVLEKAVSWLLSQQHSDGGYAPWPDISSRLSYVDSSARVLLSLAPISKAIGGPAEVEDAITRIARWICAQQDQSGGFGSRQGLQPRLNSTCFALQALVVGRDAVQSQDYPDLGKHLEVAHDWLGAAQNQDGGFGLRLGEPSNPCSSGHGGWALAALDADPSTRLANYLESLVEEPGPDLRDPIDDPGASVGGRFELLVLARPLTLIGTLLLGADPLGSRILNAVDSILQSSREGVWWVQQTRYVWPTYFHAAALRLWSRRYWAATAPFTTQYYGSSPPSRPHAAFVEPAERNAAPAPDVPSKPKPPSQPDIVAAIRSPFAMDEEEAVVRVGENAKEKLDDIVAELVRTGQIQTLPQTLPLTKDQHEVTMTLETREVILRRLEGQS